MRTSKLLSSFLVAASLCYAPCVASSNAPAAVYTFDARPLNMQDLSKPENVTRLWDTMHVLSALQGLANRQSPNLYLFYCAEFGVDTDQFWFDWLRNEDGWLRESTVTKLGDVRSVIAALRSHAKGLVVYDGSVPATANLASTAAGCEDLLPIRYDNSPDSLFTLLTKELGFPVRLWLVQSNGAALFTGKGLIPGLGTASTGSGKADAYRWAIHRWIRPGGCTPGIAAYYLDAFWLKHARRAGPAMHTLSNHDYFIKNRAFFFDLSPWSDEVPTDDQSQPLGTDRAMFFEVMRALHDHSGESIIKVGGFTPWPYKYTSHAQPPGKYDGVPTEWEFGRLISQFNGYMEADAAGLGDIANASFFTHYPLETRYRQPNARPTAELWKSRKYVTEEGKVANKLFIGHYVGDYDAPSWLYKAVPAFFRDPTRGKIPLGWAFNPNLADRAPQALVYAYRHATTNDFFISGDSGAGYLNARSLTVRPDSKLPAALDKWASHCRTYFERWDITICGFILDGAGGASTETEFKAYATFSPDGAGTHFEKGPAMRAGIPTCPERDLPDDAKAAAAQLAAASKSATNGPAFFWARSILKSPAWYSQVSAELAGQHPEAQVEVVDPFTFFGLIREHLSGRQ